MTPYVEYLSSKHKDLSLTPSAPRTDAKARHEGVFVTPELGVLKKVDSGTLWIANLACLESPRPMRDLVS